MEEITAEEILNGYASNTEQREQDDAEMPLVTLTEDGEE